VLARKRFQVLMVVLAAAGALALPAGAHATPRWFVNGMLSGPARHNVTAYGTLTMDNKLYGVWKCDTLAGLTAGNETEKGVATVEAWKPFNCSTPECRHPRVVTERPPELIERENSKKEVEYPPPPPPVQSLPWPAELITSQTGKPALKMRKMRITLVCEEEGFELPFTGYLEPPIVNGAKNGMNPSHIVFEGKGGLTSYLVSPYIEGGLETENSELFFSGELTTLGTGEELITAE
jgi:hypothetical protein